MIITEKKVRITKLEKIYENHVSSFEVGGSIEGLLIEPLKTGESVILIVDGKERIITDKVDAIIDKNHFNSAYSKFKIEYL